MMTPRQELALRIIRQNEKGVSIEALSNVWLTAEARRENLTVMARAGLIEHDPETWRWKER